MLSKISQSEKDKKHVFIHKWNLRNKTDEHGGREERPTKKLTLNYREQTDGYQRGSRLENELYRDRLRRALDDEHWVLYLNDESLNSTPKTNITLYVN